MTDVALDIKNVSHNFGSRQALRDVSLSVECGQFVALMGINGAGKTTLFSLITRLYDNITGSIEVCGFDVRRQPSQALAHLGVVFQSRALDSALTVKQNLLYHAGLHGISKNAALMRLEEVLAGVRLSDRINDRVSSLSGGQARRIELARALMHEPRMLLLDEPTVGLDVKSRQELVEHVHELAKERNIGVLWATHLTDEIQPDDKVVILHAGEVLRMDHAHAIAGETGLAQAFLDITGMRTEDILGASWAG